MVMKSLSRKTSTIVDTKHFTYCKTPVEVEAHFFLSEKDMYEQPVVCKYADLKCAIKASSGKVARLLESIPIGGMHKHSLVDIKIAQMTAGQWPCVPGWHTDCTLNVNHHTKPDVHRIIVSGAGCRTRFIDEPISIEAREDPYDYIQEQIDKLMPKTIDLEENTVYRYERDGLHTCMPAMKDGPRILIRVTETDLVRPNNNFKPNNLFRF